MKNDDPDEFSNITRRFDRVRAISGDDIVQLDGRGNTGALLQSLYEKVDGSDRCNVNVVVDNLTPVSGRPDNEGWGDVNIFAAAKYACVGMSVWGAAYSEDKTRMVFSVSEPDIFEDIYGMEFPDLYAPAFNN